MSLFVIVLLPFECLRALSLSKRLVLVIEAMTADRARAGARLRIRQGDY
ncbi:MAG TPA: hypothetical protein VGW39_00465 [Chthoniobacterales bacterium]|nr:hypothetical protein [Chthoniobacterales bacterium]